MDLFRGKVTAKDWIAVAVILSIAALAAAGCYLIVFKKQAERLETKNSELSVVTRELDVAMDQEKNIGQLEVDMEKIQTLVRQFELRLPSQREIPTFAQQFEEMAREAGLEVGVKQMPSVRDTQKETIPFNITAFGDFHQIVEFINSLERFERYLKISELNIAEQEAGLGKATFTLSTFRIIEQAPRPAPAAPGGKPA